MTRYYCDYCDTYLTHDSVRPHMRAYPVTLLYLSDLNLSEFSKSVVTFKHSILTAACGTETAQHRVQAQGEFLL